MELDGLDHSGICCQWVDLDWLDSGVCCQWVDLDWLGCVGECYQWMELAGLGHIGVCCQWVGLDWLGHSGVFCKWVDLDVDLSRLYHKCMNHDQLRHSGWCHFYELALKQNTVFLTNAIICDLVGHYEHTHVKCLHHVTASGWLDKKCSLLQVKAFPAWTCLVTFTESSAASCWLTSCQKAHSYLYLFC